jgi:hypothetical protein
MTFLYPSFLWALGVLSIPIIIHLFNFRKTTRVYFSNNRFLRQVKENTTARRKLKHYLILASRLFFLFFLVVAFAQPMLPATDEQVNHQNVVFYLDNSQSMSAPMEDRTRGLDAGIKFITNLVEAFPVDSKYKLITNDFAPYSNTFKSKAEILELLSAVRLSPITRTVDEVKERILRDETVRDTEVFWISDFQKSTAGDKIAKASDSLLRWHLAPIRFEEVSNVFVDTVYLDNPFASSGERNVLRVKVRNEGSQSVDQLGIKLNINGVQAGTAAVDVPAGGVNEAAFDLTTRLTGLNRGSISFNDFPVSFDNEFYFTLNFKEKIRVIEVHGNLSVTPVEKVFGNQEIFSYRGFPLSNFNYSLLNEADLVVVNGLNTVDAALSTALNDYLRRDGTVLLIPGVDPEPVSLRTFIQMPSLNRVQGKVLMELDKPDFANPFFENVFEERSSSLVMPKGAPIIDWGIDRTAVLRFKNDKPFLSRLSRSGGSIFLLASPLDAAFTDFYNHALFVPVMYRLASGSKKQEVKLYHKLKENLITLRLDSLADDEQLRLVSEEEIIPSQRRVGPLVMMELPRHTLKTGFYHVVAARDTVELVAFNSDKEESVLSQFSETEVKAFFGSGDNISIFDAGGTDTFSNEIKERYLGTPLWKFAILLAFLFLVVEVLLIRFLK